MWETYLDHALWAVIGFILGVITGLASNTLHAIHNDTRKLLARTAHIEQEVTHHDDHP